MRARRPKDIKSRKPSRAPIPAEGHTKRQSVIHDDLQMTLRDLRESVGKTQDEIGHLAKFSQSQLSRIERRRDHLTSTLRRYVRALGGTVEVIAIVGEKRIPLRDV
jgi:hypothetical protein